MGNETEITTIDQYIALAAPISQPILSEIRRVVNKAVPEATETISYKLPAFKLHRTFFYFAAFKNHIGVYPPVTGDPELINELLPYANEKGLPLCLSKAMTLSGVSFALHKKMFA